MYRWGTGQRLSVSLLALAVPFSPLCAWQVLPAQPPCGCLGDGRGYREPTMKRTEIGRMEVESLLLLLKY